MVTIMNCIEDFSKASGLRISLAKSPLFVSPNVTNQLAGLLSLSSGIPLTTDLGTYLGLPIIHSRINKETYSNLLDLVLKRLAAWKGLICNKACFTSVILIQASSGYI